jgi:ferrous iron transport protein A
VSAAPNEFESLAVRDAGSRERTAALRLRAGYMRPLSDLPARADGRIVGLTMPDGVHDPELVARLGELGFLPGERVRIVARGLFGDPLAVRVGTGTFALRRAEARCVQVHVEGESRPK